MLPFGHLKNEVARKLGVPVGGDYANTQIRDYLIRRYRWLWDAQNWPLALEVIAVTVPAGQNSFLLPKQYETALALLNTTASGDTNNFNLVDFARRNLRAVAQGWPMTNELAPLQAYSVAEQPDTPGPVRVSSSAVDDKSVQVFVRGVSNNEIRSEVITTNATDGTTPVTGTVSFSELHAVTKLTVPTAGVISVTNPTGAVVYTTIGQYEVSPQYKRYQIAPAAAGQDQSLRVVVKKRFMPFLNNADVALFDMDSALIHGATADGWMEHRQYDMATAEEMKFQEAYEQLVARELNLAGHRDIWAQTGRF